MIFLIIKFQIGLKFRAQGIMIIYKKKSNALRYQLEDFNE